jgi:uncharacterized protein YegP (UPF0339 family)
MPGMFVLKKNAKGQFHFVLKASNGETIATPETYSSKSGAMNGNRVGPEERWQREGRGPVRRRRYPRP